MRPQRCGCRHATTGEVAVDGRAEEAAGRFVRALQDRTDTSFAQVLMIKSLVDEAEFVPPDLGTGNQFRMVIHLQSEEDTP